MKSGILAPVNSLQAEAEHEIWIWLLILNPACGLRGRAIEPLTPCLSAHQSRAAFSAGAAASFSETNNRRPSLTELYKCKNTLDRRK